MTLWVDTGNGGFPVESWEKWMACWLRAVLYAMHVKTHGACRCGCTVKLCAYCVHECFV